MKKTGLLIFLILVLTTGVPVLADGMFYWSEEIPPEIPYQRAILLFDGERETLILQSKYQVMNATIDDSFGWVVPVPSVPELASIDPQLADSLFSELSDRARLQPRVIRISHILFLSIAFILPIGSILLLLACWLSFYVPALHLVQRHRRWLIISAFLALVPAACAYLAVFLNPRVAWNPLPPSVDTIKAEQVGIYDVQVIKAQQDNDLIEWLNQNHFQFDQEDTQLFSNYIRQGWCFVVARIDPSSGIDKQNVASEGLAAPLLLRFQAEVPVYPLRLTSTSGQETQVLLYMLSESKWQNDGRLALHYAGRTRLPRRQNLRSQVDPEGYFTRMDLALPYLCKFKGTLMPEQMRDDLVFTLAEDDEPYPKRVFTW
ncbi:MAG: DUF2330 domain-containing protein [Anaerolineae bacterium]|jgi:hypothetical protein